MLPAAASSMVYGAYAYHAAHRISRKGIATVAAAHVGVLALLATADMVPVPAPLATLMVQVLPPAPRPALQVAAPKPQPVEPQPVEPKPVPRPGPLPRPKPVPEPRPQTLAAQNPVPTPAAEAPAIKEAPPPTPAPAAAPAAPPASAPAAAPAAPPAPTETPPRFDTDYLSNPAPAYPGLSRRLGEEGKVVLRVFVEPSGRAGQIEIKTSSGFPRLDRAAQEAVSSWKFISARRGDEAVGAWVLVPIVFNLRG